LMYLVIVTIKLNSMTLSIKTVIYKVVV
jgi:hypothetical protein